MLVETAVLVLHLIFLALAQLLLAGVEVVPTQLAELAVLVAVVMEALLVLLLLRDRATLAAAAVVYALLDHRHLAALAWSLFATPALFSTLLVAH